MFIERIKEKYTNDDPIFTKEILDLFPDYSRAQVFRLIKKAVDDKEIMMFSRGVYILPTPSIIGTVMSTSAEYVAMKRYVKNSGEVFGLFSGTYLLNSFSITTQVPATIDIVTNNEATRKRVLYINGMRFILKKSRVEITKNNYSAYTILQLFTDMDDSDEFDYHSKDVFLGYVSRNNVKRKEILSLMEYFPAKTVKRVIRSKILDEIA